MEKILTILTISLLLTSCSGIDTSQSSKNWKDISYSQESNTQKLDIYLPKTGVAPYPVIFAVHGGAFKMGSKTGNDIASVYKGLNYGYAIVAVDYRLSSEAIFPAAINDIQSAIRYIKTNAKTYNLNPDKLAIWGDSAGGHLAALAGTKGTQSGGTNVQVVVDWFGPIYFSRMDSEFKTLGITPAMGNTNNSNSPESAYIGKTIGTPEAESLVKEASPETYITPDDPIFYIQHGTADKNIPITQSENFAEVLTNILGSEKVIFEKIEGASHGGEAFDSDENLKKIFTFLDKQLK